MKNESRLSSVLVTNPLQHLFSTRCSQYKHRLCSGFSKRNSPSFMCACDCHEGVEIINKLIDASKVNEVQN